MKIEYPTKTDGEWVIVLKNKEDEVIGRYVFPTEEEAVQFLSIGSVVINEGLYDDGK